MRIAVIFVLLAASLVQAHPQSSLTANTKLGGTGVIHQNALDYLIDMGLRNNVSLGIVIEGDSLCAHRFKESNEESTLRNLIAQIEAQVPGYTGEVRSGSVFVHPKTMQPQTMAVLSLVVPEFSTQKSDPQQVGVSLWMYIRAVLVPNEGSAFVGGSRSHEEAIDPFEITNATVESILDLIMTKEKGGLWVMHQVPPDWLLNPKSVPYELYQYSGDQDLIRSLTCTSPR